jgi:hypothetical protein
VDVSRDARDLLQGHPGERRNRHVRCPHLPDIPSRPSPRCLPPELLLANDVLPWWLGSYMLGGCFLEVITKGSREPFDWITEGLHQYRLNEKTRMFNTIKVGHGAGLSPAGEGLSCCWLVAGRARAAVGVDVGTLAQGPRPAGSVPGCHPVQLLGLTWLQAACAATDAGLNVTFEPAFSTHTSVLSREYDRFFGLITRMLYWDPRNPSRLGSDSVVTEVRLDCIQCCFHVEPQSINSSPESSPLMSTLRPCSLKK